MILEIDDHGTPTSIKLGPEATGYRLRPGTQADLTQGARALLSPHHPTAIEILILQPR